MRWTGDVTIETEWNKHMEPMGVDWLTYHDLSTIILTLALPFFSDIRMLQNDPTLGPEIDAKQKKDGLTGTPLLIQVYELWCSAGILLHKWGVWCKVNFSKLSMDSIHSIWNL